MLIAALVAFSALTGCASSRQEVTQSPPQIVLDSLALFETELWGADTAKSAPAGNSFLELPADFRFFLDREVVTLDTEENRFNALRKWTFEIIEDYEYDPSFTSPLASLPENGRINCFSFSNLFVAAARYVDVPASFQLVESPPQWDINSDTWVVSQHINVTGSVYRKLTPQERQYIRDQQQTTGTLIRHTPPFSGDRAYVIDLNPEIAVDAYRSEVITDREALSLFYSNRSVEEMLSGRRDAALEYGRLAILSDRESVTAWTNLGVLLSRQGKLQEAQQAYLTALALDPGTESAANNLERIYRRMGKTDKADAMAAEIRSNRKKNPYYHYALGEKMLAMGEPQEAVEHFKDAISRKDDERLFYFGLAEAQMELGDYRRASRSLDTARKYATPADNQRYEALNHKLSSAGNEG